MAASSILQVYNYNEASDRALKTYLTTWGITPIIPAATTDAEDTLLIPNLQVGSGTHMYKCPDGKWRFDLFNDCIIELNLVTPRIPGATSATLAAIYTLYGESLARIRAALDYGQSFVALNALLDLHHVTRLFPLGATQGFDPATGDDRATIRYRCALGIKPDSWPTDLTAYYPPGS